MLKYCGQVSVEVLMQPVQECLCKAVLFQGFVVTSILDAYHISLLLKSIIVKTQGRFILEIIPRTFN